MHDFKVGDKVAFYPNRKIDHYSAKDGHTATVVQADTICCGEPGIRIVWDAGTAQQDGNYFARMFKPVNTVKYFIGKEGSWEGTEQKYGTFDSTAIKFYDFNHKHIKKFDNCYASDALNSTKRFEEFIGKGLWVLVTPESLGILPSKPAVQDLYIVWCPTGKTPPTMRYKTLQKAEEVAKIMAERYKGQEFYAMKAMKGFKTEETKTYHTVEIKFS